MNFKKNKDNIIVGFLAILFIVGIFEITGYFFFTYKPASQIFGSNKSYRLEIPAISQIVKPMQLTNQEMSLADTPRTLFANKIFDFKSILDEKIVNSNTFIKDSNINYILGGKLSEVTKNPDQSVTVKLTNSTGATISETFTDGELKNVSISLITLSITNPSRVFITLDKALPNDYLIVKTSSNLLDRSPANKIEMEVFRTPKQ